jgi:tetratricopeptide (TPR) repeat protein
MDRSSLLPRRLALPLVGLASVGLLWLAWPGRPASSTHDIPLRSASGPDLQAPTAIAQPTPRGGPAVASPLAKDHPNKNSRTRHAPRDGFPHAEREEYVQQPAGTSLPSLRPRTRAVLATAYSAGESVDRDFSWPDGNASTLVPAAPPTAKPAPPTEVLLPIAQPPATSAKAPAPTTDVPPPLVKHVPQVSTSTVDATPRMLPDPPLAVPVQASPAGRSRQLESIAQQADHHSRQGFELAERGAYYAARREFTAALRLVAQGLDMERQTDRHNRALALALTAVAEAQDFLPVADRLDGDLNLADIVARHRTPVLKGAADHVSPMEAMKSYFTFAQEQLAQAVEHEVAGSMALHGLGKLHSALAEQETLRTRGTESKAMTFYQAALLVDPRNFMASNDLGVLLARSGCYAEARAALEHSLSVSPQAAGWRNLAQVYRRLGDQERATRAERLFQIAERDRAAHKRQTPAGRVDWVDPQAFAQTFAQTPSAREPLPARPAAAKPEQPVAQKPFSNLYEKR